MPPESNQKDGVVGETSAGQAFRWMRPDNFVRMEEARQKQEWATRGYQSDCEDRSRRWEAPKASGPAKENEGVSEAVAVAEVETVDNRDKNHGRAAADSATCTASVHSATFRSRLGEINRLSNNRKSSLSATCKRHEPEDNTGLGRSGGGVHCLRGFLEKGDV